MKLQLIGFTPRLEEVLATAVLTTTAGSTPSKVFSRVSGDPKRVKSLIEGLQLQHGSVLEHNRIDWLLEASDKEAFNLLLRSKFFNLTRLEEGLWLLSANLRTIVEYVTAEDGPMRDALFDSMKEFAPTILRCLEAKIREG